MDLLTPDPAEERARERVLTGIARAGLCAILAALAGAAAVVVALVTITKVVSHGHPLARVVEGVSVAALSVGVVFLALGGADAKRGGESGSPQRAWNGLRVACVGAVLTAIPVLCGGAYAWTLAIRGGIPARTANLTLVAGGPFVLAAAAFLILVLLHARALRGYAMAASETSAEPFLPTWSRVRSEFGPLLWIGVVYLAFRLIRWVF